MCIYTHVSPRRTPQEKDAHGAAEGIQLALSSWQRTLLHARSPFQPGTHEPKVESALDVFLQHPCTSAHRIMQLLRCPPPWPPNPGLLHQLHRRCLGQLRYDGQRLALGAWPRCLAYRVRCPTATDRSESRPKK